MPNYFFYQFYWLNNLLKKPSALYPFTIFKPDKVSSVIEIKYPFSCCARVDCDFNDFPIFEMINPEIGINMKTNNVSSQLIFIIAINEKIMVNGSFTISSNTKKNEF